MAVNLTLCETGQVSVCVGTRDGGSADTAQPLALNAKTAAVASGILVFLFCAVGWSEDRLSKSVRWRERLGGLVVLGQRGEGNLL